MAGRKIGAPRTPNSAIKINSRPRPNIKKYQNPAITPKHMKRAKVIFMDIRKENPKIAENVEMVAERISKNANLKSNEAYQIAQKLINVERMKTITKNQSSK